MALSAAMEISHWSTISKPPAMQYPLMAAITGLLTLDNALVDFEVR